jgi:hypothetical protein
MSFDERWLPYLGDQVSIQMGNLPVAGQASRFDPALVEVDTPMRVQVGDVVEASWQVGVGQHRCAATVEDVTPDGFTVRLPPERTSRGTRRRHERVNVSLGLALNHTQNGSMAEAGCVGRTLDLSDSGARALIDTSEPLVIGEVLQVRLELDGEVETLTATVVWEREHGAGERLAGLRFAGEVRASRWAALAAHTA